MEALTAVFQRSEAEATDRLVLLVLANSANEETGEVFLSVKRIAERARVSARTVQYALRRLEEAGELERVGVHPQYGTIVYTITVERGGADFAGVQPVAPGGVQPLAPGGVQPVAPEPKKEPKIEPKSSLRPRASIASTEPIGFSEWLGHHVTVQGAKQAPRAGTSYRAELARLYRILTDEGYSMDDLKAASTAVCADEWRREQGHIAPENVLRKTKVGKWVERGRRTREREAQLEDVNARRAETFLADLEEGE